MASVFQTGRQVIGFDVAGRCEGWVSVTEKRFAGGADPTGVADSTAAFTAVESGSAEEALLPDGTYVVNGIQLKKRYYGPGSILLDGSVRRGWSLARGRDLAADYMRKLEALGSASHGRPCAITRRDADTLAAYRPLGGPFWQEIQLSNGGGAGPYSWNQSRIVALMSVSLVTAGSYTGAGWVDLVTQDPTKYLGGRAKQNATNGDYVEFSVNTGGDLFLIYTQRTGGGYVRVDVDGSTEAASALPSNGTYRYVDTYGATDNVYRARAKIATALPYGSHTIRFTVTNQKNAASSGYLFQFEGIGATGSIMGLPSRSDTRPPTWTTGVAYSQYDQVQYLGRNYSASGSGTAGATPPTHTTGTVSDGTVSWLYMASSSYDVAAHTVQAAGSQLEYAYQIRPTGTSTYEDVGGLVHGNEALASVSVDVDGVSAGSLAAGAWLAGDVITVTQSITTSHTGTGATNIADVTLTHRVAADGVTVDHRHVWNVAASVGYFYSAMWPLLAYDAGTFRYAMDWLWTPQGGKYLTAAYRGQSNPIVGRSPDVLMVAAGDVLGANGAAGVPSSAAGPVSAVASLSMDPLGVDEYRASGTYYAGMAMNLSGADPTVNGYSSHPAKMYFERASGAAPVSVAAGEVWPIRSVYRLSLVPGTVNEP